MPGGVSPENSFKRNPYPLPYPAIINMYNIKHPILPKKKRKG